MFLIGRGLGIRIQIGAVTGAGAGQGAEPGLEAAQSSRLIHAAIPYSARYRLYTARIADRHRARSARNVGASG